jgi:N-methylhydantoinase A
VYFPYDSVVSVTTDVSGTLTEVATIGPEGMTGLPTVLGTETAPMRVVLQVGGTLGAVPTEEFRRLFDTEHHQRYGQAAPDERLEVVNIRLVVSAGRPDTLAEQWLSAPWEPEPAVADDWRDVIFTDAARPLRTRVVWRPSLAAGARIEGPAVIEEPNATTLIHPGDLATVSDAGHLIIDVALQSAETP